MDTETGKVYNAAQLKAVLDSLESPKREELQRRIVEISDIVAEKMRLGNKAYKKKIKREKTRQLKKQQNS